MNSILRSGCSFWVNKKCSDILGRLVEDPDFRCRRRLGNAPAIDGRLELKSNLSMESLM